MRWQNFFTSGSSAGGISAKRQAVLTNVIIHFLSPILMEGLKMYTYGFFHVLEESLS